MSPFGVMFVAVGLQYVLSGRYPTIVLDQVGITYRPYEDVVTLLRRGPRREAPLGRDLERRIRTQLCGPMAGTSVARRSFRYLNGSSSPR